MQLDLLLAVEARGPCEAGQSARQPHAQLLKCLIRPRCHQVLLVRVCVKPASRHCRRTGCQGKNAYTLMPGFPKQN